MLEKFIIHLGSLRALFLLFIWQVDVVDNLYRVYLRLIAIGTFKAQERRRLLLVKKPAHILRAPLADVPGQVIQSGTLAVFRLLLLFLESKLSAPRW